MKIYGAKKTQNTGNQTFSICLNVFFKNFLRIHAWLAQVIRFNKIFFNQQPNGLLTVFK